MLGGIPGLMEDLIDFADPVVVVVVFFLVASVRGAVAQVFLILVVCMCYDPQSSIFCKNMIRVQRRQAHIRCFFNHKWSYIRECMEVADMPSRYKVGHIQ